MFLYCSRPAYSDRPSARVKQPNNSAQREVDTGLAKGAAAHTAGLIRQPRRT